MIGVPTDVNNLSEGAPHVLVIDPASGRIADDMQVDGVKAGQFREAVPGATTASGGQAWQYAIYSPGLAWDSERNLLYIAHADEEKVSVINVGTGVIIAQTLLLPAQSLLERLAIWWIPSAEAKGGPEVERRALISPDGKRLYVLSQAKERGVLGAATLRVIATDGMREIGRLEGLLTEFALTPDGKSLLVIKGEVVKPYGFDMIVNRDVYVLEAESLQEQAHLRTDQVDQLSFRGFSPDWRSAYLSGYTARWVEGSGWRDGRSIWQVLDLQSSVLTQRGETAGGFASLVQVIH